MSVFNIPTSCEESLINGYLDDDGYKRCPYCGSMQPTELANLIKEGKAKMSGSDWKYGYPHKFYVDIINGEEKKYAKFYINHLSLIDIETFNIVSPIITEACGIIFERDEIGLKYKAPYYNYQK